MQGDSRYNVSLDSPLNGPLLSGAPVYASSDGTVVASQVISEEVMPILRIVHTLREDSVPQSRKRVSEFAPGNEPCAGGLDILKGEAPSRPSV